MQKPILNILIIFTVFINLSTAQYSFVNYDYTNGMPLDEVKEIVEDKIGYIWLGGPLGLSRFDGKNFTHYYLGSETYNVAGNIVNDIKVTPSGDVVAVYEDNGISIYNHQTDSFRSKKYDSSYGSNFPQYSIFFVYIENDTSAYLGADREGLFHINLKTLDSKKIALDYIAYDMQPDPTHDQSYYVTGGGLHRLNMASLELDKLTNQGFSGINIFNDDVWYNGYVNLIKKYNTDSGTDRVYNLVSQSIVRGWTIVDKNLWVATSSGIEVIDTSSAELITIMKAGTGIHDLQGSFIYEIYKDSKNRVWVASDGGIGLYDPSKAYFTRSQMLKNQSTDLSKIDSNNFLSMDFYNHKVYHIKERGKEKEVRIEKGLKEPIEAIHNRNRTLVLFFNGVGEYHKNDNTISKYDCPFTESGDRGLVDLFIEDDKWIGIYRYRNIMVAWNKVTDKRDTLKFEREPRGIVPINDGNVLIYGVNLLWKYNLASGIATQHPLDDKQYAPLGADIVKIEKIKSSFWIGTRINGVFKASYNGDGLVLEKHYNEDDGLTNNNVVKLYVDEYNNLFIQCRSNIFMLDKVKDRFFTLGGSNDLNLQITYDLIVIDSIVYALGAQSKSLDLHNVDTSISDFKTNIEFIKLNGVKNLEYSSDKTSLKHTENNLNITFNTIEYGDPSSIRHRYRLTTTGEWIYLDPGNRSIQLMAMAEGKYNFQLSTGNGNGLWSRPLDWKFSITPPFWKAWWFLLFIFSTLALIGYFIYKLRMNQLNKLNKMDLKLAELESESLRAQMNPHFVFNALNSIKFYIIKNSKEEAADYLTKFSQLIRAVLRNSTQKEITLRDELEALTLYLQIENLRLNQPFEYKINIAEDIDPLTTAFPPLIIQPFVENSIWHGFAHKKTPGKLTINIHKEMDKLNIEVIDDGVGREKSKEIEKSRERKRSYGVALTVTRLINITDKAEIQIIDLYDNNGLGNGTKVEIELPFRNLKVKNQ